MVDERKLERKYIKNTRKSVNASQKRGDWSSYSKWFPPDRLHRNARNGCHGRVARGRKFLRYATRRDVVCPRDRRRPHGGCRTYTLSFVKSDGGISALATGAGRCLGTVRQRRRRGGRANAYRAAIPKFLLRGVTWCNIPPTFSLVWMFPLPLSAKTRFDGFEAIGDTDTCPRLGSKQCKYSNSFYDC